MADAPAPPAPQSWPGAAFGLPAPRTLNLSDGAGAGERTGPDAPRVIVNSEALAAVLALGPDAWSSVKGAGWEKLLRDSGLLEAFTAVGADGSKVESARGGASEPVMALVRLFVRLGEILAMEKRLGEDAFDDGTRPAREVDTLVLILCVAGLMGTVAPIYAHEVFMFGFTVVGLRAAWRVYGPRPKITRESLLAARQEMARSLASFASHTWICAVGDRVLESTPHADYLRRRLVDLDAARGVSEAQVREINQLITGVRSANARLNLPEEDGETRRLLAQREATLTRIQQIERLRETIATRLGSYQDQVERLRALASRRALSARVASMTEGGARDAVDQEIAEVEVDIVDLEQRLGALEIEASDANADLLSLLETGGAIKRRVRA